MCTSHFQLPEKPCHCCSRRRLPSWSRKRHLMSLYSIALALAHFYSSPTLHLVLLLLMLPLLQQNEDHHHELLERREGERVYISTETPFYCWKRRQRHSTPLTCSLSVSLPFSATSLDDTQWKRSMTRYFCIEIQMPLTTGWKQFTFPSIHAVQCYVFRSDVMNSHLSMLLSLSPFLFLFFCPQSIRLCVCFVFPCTSHFKLIRLSVQCHRFSAPLFTSSLSDWLFVHYAPSHHLLPLLFFSSSCAFHSAPLNRFYERKKRERKREEERKSLLCFHFHCTCVCIFI